MRKKIIVFSLLTAVLLTSSPAGNSLSVQTFAKSIASLPAVTKGSVNNEDIFINKVKVKKHTMKKTYKNDKNKTVMTVKYIRPVLQGNYSSIRLINRFYEKREKEWLKTISPNLKDARELSKHEGFPIYSEEVFCDVTYNQKGYLSILTTGYTYTGGAHGTPYFEGHTFGLNTGRKLNLTDIMKGTNKTLNKKITAAFQKEMKKDPNKYFDDALKVIKASAGKDSPFYLMKNKICFYYDVYAIAPYAAGRTEAYIPYTAEASFKIKL